MATHSLAGRVRKTFLFVSMLTLAVVNTVGAPAFAADTAVTPPVDATLAKLVPSYYRDKGTIVVGVNPDVAPIKFVNDDGELVGFTPDLMSAAASVLGLKLDFEKGSFDAMVPGMQAGRYDVLLSLSDFESRHKTITFIDYLNMGETLVISPANPVAVSSKDDLCGMRVAVTRGTGEMHEAQQLSTDCEKNGKKSVSVATYPDTNTAMLTLISGSADVAWVDSPVGYYNASKFPSKYKVVYFIPLAPYGIGFGVDDKSKQLVAAFQKALIKLNATGDYDKLMAKWGINPKDGQPGFPINGAKL